MPAKSNRDMLAKVEDALENSKGVFVINYDGLTVAQAQDLRHALRENDAQMKVFKNNIVRIALQNAGYEELGEALVGPCAYVFYQNDPVDAAKAIKDEASKLEGDDRLQFVGAVADGKVLSAEEAKAYADLPTREELIAKFVGTISNPLSGIVRVLNGPAQGLATALEAVVDQKNAA